jgi:hypothetical protein
MKSVPLFAALLAAIGLPGAQRAEAAGVEQTLNVSFTGVYQGPASVAGGIETKTSKTVGITDAQIVRAVAFDLGDTSFTTWNGAALRLRTDFATGARSLILRKGTNTATVSRFFTNVPGLDVLDLENRTDYLEPVRNSSTKLLTFPTIRITGLETLQLTTTNLTFALNGYGNGGVLMTTRVFPATFATPRTTNTVPIVLLRVPSQDPDPGPVASGSFAYTNSISGPVYNGVITLGNPDTSH